MDINKKRQLETEMGEAEGTAEDEDEDEREKKRKKWLKREEKALYYCYMLYYKLE